MELSDRQCDRVAGHLDGEAVDLTADEQAAAQEIRRAEKALPAMLEVPLPPRAIDCARRRMMRKLARPRAGVLRFATSAAAAAVLIAAATVWFWPAGPTEPPLAEISYEAMIATYARADVNIDLDLIQQELEEFEAELVVSLPAGSADIELDAIQETLEGFWLEETESWPGES